jgi:hypothetical protein
MIRLGSKARKQSFFEKKDQKTFLLALVGGVGSLSGRSTFQQRTDKSFLLLFCKKEDFLS